MAVKNPLCNYGGQIEELQSGDTLPGGGGGGGTSVTTKGDLQGFDTAADRIPVGTDGQQIVADSSQALGLKWTDPRASTLNFQQKGTPTDPGERWFVVGAIFSGNVTTSSPGTGAIRAIPFTIDFNCTCDKISAEVTTLIAASNLRLGIYTNKTNGALYPDQLLVDSGDISCATTGVKTASISVPLFAKTIYWAVVITSSTQALRTPLDVASCLGMSPSMGAPVSGCIALGRSYGAFLTTFDSGAAASASTPPVIALHFT